MYEILLNPTSGHGVPHIPTLAVHTKFLDPDLGGKTRWDPDYLITVPTIDAGGNMVANEQVGIWRLDNRVVTFTGASGAVTPWGDRDETIDLADNHGGSTLPAQVGFSVIRIDDGTPSSQSLSRFTLKNTKAGDLERDCATEVRWTGLPLLIESGVVALKFKKSLTGPPFANISNLANEMNGLPHFHHYYDLLRDASGKPIDKAKQITITHAGPDVYDCVPPTAAP
jgi:hypothetical protein